MQDLSSTAGAAPGSHTGSGAGLGDDLPPVQPPSAGFIIQLFVVPALIVLAVVGVWALFGRLAAGEQDWRHLVQDLQSGNPNVSQRAMFGLAQLLDADRRLGEGGQHLALNQEIATALSTQLQKSLDSTSQTPEAVSLEVFLTRALGLIDLPETTLPVLKTALDAKYDVEVRKGAITSVALVCSRAGEFDATVESGATDAVVGLSQESDPTLKRAATFALGLLPVRTAGNAAEQRDQRLRVLLEDPEDWMTSVNAAIALARRKSTDGYPVFVKALGNTVDVNNAEALQDHLTILKNTLRAVAELGTHWTPEQRSSLEALVKPLADDHNLTRIRVDAQSALAALGSKS